MVDDEVGAARFAASLRALKARSGLSYEALARRSGISGSSLHRYCNGTKIPARFDTVESLARVCGATAEELSALHRLWVLADLTRAPAAEPAPASAPPGADDQEPAPPRPWARRKGPALAAVATLAVAAAALAWTVSGDAAKPSGAEDRRLLFSRACREPVSMGQHDECVREVQSLLERKGAKIGVDGDFGPQTLRRVTAFQVLAGLPPKGVVDDETKHALYERPVSMPQVPSEQIERRIREVFPEEPDRAAGIARCQSLLDPLHILPNTNGSRNWGLFQISDGRLAELGGTPLLAFDPEWNIQAARRLWAQNRDFRHWPQCDQLYRTPSPTAVRP
ncbi:helix-turn-helix domain-containing protein [Streptomyces sp. NPDC048337]|uniref:helix-turn-helix domain-containing protein n=1 Tax=Streptomyces sp. NPDC048337 TaxID=3365535 RepID=UPI0037221377